MADITKELFSGSSGGRGIKIGATVSPGTLVHATGTSATIKDEVWLALQNNDTSEREAIIQWGDVTSVDDDVRVTIPSRVGLIVAIPGHCLSGTGAAARNVRVYCATTNVLVAHGFVNRITP